jgi:hypothetical protein
VLVALGPATQIAPQIQGATAEVHQFAHRICGILGCSSTGGAV